MSEQREKPGVTVPQLAGALGVDSTGMIVSGGQFEGFEEGWALPVMCDAKRSHYYRRENFGMATSLCGHTHSAMCLYGEGNWPRCKRCEAMARTMASASRQSTAAPARP